MAEWSAWATQQTNFDPQVPRRFNNSTTSPLVPAAVVVEHREQHRTRREAQ
jgi:hypothetical protein